MESGKLHGIDFEDPMEFIPFDNSDYNTQQLQCFMPFQSHNISMKALPLIPRLKEFNKVLPINIPCFPMDSVSNKINSLPRNLPCTYLESIDNEFNNRKSLRNSTSSISIRASNILSSIEETTPTVFKTLNSYNIPYPIGELLVKKIILLTLEFESKQ